MAFDGVVAGAVKNELSSHLHGARIDKIYQPEPLTIYLNLRKNRENYKLLISVHPVYARICLTEHNYTNPQNPPLFCMVMRKHLEGGRIISIEQTPLERVLTFKIESLTELGSLSYKYLHVEIMGKHSNIILTAEDNNEEKIIDSIKRISQANSTIRQVLPGRMYQPPPAQNKLNFLTTNKEDFIKSLLEQKLEQPLEKVLVNSLMGISPSLASQITAKSNLKGYLLEYCGEHELFSLWKTISLLSSVIINNEYTPLIITNQEKQYIGYSPINVPEYHLDNFIEFAQITNLIDNFYTWKIMQDSFFSTKNNLYKIINKEIQKSLKKLTIQLEAIKDSENSLQNKIYGELIIANMHLIKTGMKELRVPNFYNNNELTKVTLKAELTPSQNAQAYFKKYNKAKKTIQKAKKYAGEVKKELEYLDTLSFWLSEINNFEDFEQLKNELIENGYLKEKITNIKKKANKKSPKPKTSVNSYYILDDFKIYVGKNNKQNELLTFKIATDDDLWLHAKNVPGSHVIIKQENSIVNDEIIEKAAILAAYNSKSKNSINVPVDYTKAKNIKKIKGAKPGLVTYSKFKTIYVSPHETEINKLQENLIQITNK